MLIARQGSRPLPGTGGRYFLPIPKEDPTDDTALTQSETDERLRQHSKHLRYWWRMRSNRECSDINHDMQARQKRLHEKSTEFGQCWTCGCGVCLCPVGSCYCGHCVLGAALRLQEYFEIPHGFSEAECQTLLQTPTQDEPLPAEFDWLKRWGTSDKDRTMWVMGGWGPFGWWWGRRWWRNYCG